MDRSDIYRAKAQACEALAAKSKDFDVRKRFAELARWWRDRAAEEETSRIVTKK